MISRSLLVISLSIFSLSVGLQHTHSTVCVVFHHNQLLFFVAQIHVCFIEDDSLRQKQRSVLDSEERGEGRVLERLCSHNNGSVVDHAPTATSVANTRP